ncbi:MAG: aspartate aminotransferase family protein [Gammaproteobacteria bacterium]|nr:aspartate aminotransferase family protein [Gammaproteobacteria bacterium]
MTDWQSIERWDRAYYLHNVQAQSEYAFCAVERQDGNYLWLADGTRLLDFQSQLISDGLGHRHPGTYAEIRKAMDRYGHVFFGMASEYRARAAKLIIEDVLGAHGWAGRVRVLASGTEAVDSCMTMARLYTGRPVVLTQQHSFHGLTVGATWLRGYRNNLSPPDFAHAIDSPDFPRSGFAAIPPPEHQRYVSAGPLPSIVETEAIIGRIGADKIAAIITEPMLGAAGIPSHPEYLPAIRALCDRHDLLWIDDEVLCGFGRLGEWFGYQVFGDSVPDLVAAGKAVNGCALPAGVVIASKPIAEYFDRARWWSGSTWDGHPLVCASIVGAIESMLATDMLARVRSRGAYLRNRLEALADRHPCVGRTGGWGLFYAVDLVDSNGRPIIPSDRDTDFTGDLAGHPNNIVARECARRGVLLGGFVPNTIKIGPPYTIEESEIDIAMDAFDAALTQVDNVIR